MEDLGVSHEGFDAQYKVEKKPISWKDILKTIGSIILSKRTERAGRISFFLLFPLLFFYYEWIDMNFLYSCPLIYLLMCALLPPRIAAISLVLTMIHLGILLSSAWATLMDVVIVGSYFSIEEKYKTVLLFLVFVASLAPLKMGKASGITSIVANISCYVCILTFLNMYPFLVSGFCFEILFSDLAAYIKQHGQGAIGNLPKLPEEMQKLLMKLIFSPPGTIPWFKPLVMKVRIPNNIVESIPNSHKLAGMQATLVISRESMRITLPPGNWLIDLMWNATGHMGGIRPLYTSAAIAMSFFFLSLLTPPQRLSRFLLQHSIKELVSHALRTLCNAVSVEKNTCFLLFCSENSLTYFSNNERYVEIFNEEEAINQGNLEKIDGKFVKASLEAFEMKNKYSLSNDIITTEALPALTKLCMVEVSLLKPGMLYWFCMKYQPILEEVSKMVIHAYNIQKLFNEYADDKTLTSYNVMLRILNLEGLRITQSINTNNLNTWIVNCGHPFKSYIHSATMVYHINLKMLTPVPLFKDCQRRNGKYFCSVLEKSTTKLKKHYGSSDEPFLYLIDKAESWEEKVLYLGIAWELKNMTKDSLLALSMRVNNLTEAMEIDKKPKYIFYNIAAFFSTMLFFAIVYCHNIIFLFLPWKWTWKTPASWIHTKLPWYRSHRLLFCVKWIVGIIVLFSIIIFNDSIRVWKLEDGVPYRVNIAYIEGMTTKVSSWTILAFLTTFYSTYEGTFRRSILRLTGMFIGSILGFLCVTIFGIDNKIPQIIWVIITTFIVCYISGNSKNPLLGFDPSWGYACQLFLYQQGIIIFESFAQLQTAKDLLVSRIIANLIGVATSLFMSFIIFPTSAENCLGFLVKQVLNATHQGMLYQSYYTCCNKNPNYKQSSLDKNEQIILICENTDDADTPCYRQMGSLLSKEEFEEKIHFFDNLVNEAFENICHYEKEITIFKQLSLPFSNNAFRKSITSIKLMIHRHKEFRQCFRTALEYSSASFCDTINNLLCDLNSVIKFIDKTLVDETSSYYWYSEYVRIFTSRQSEKTNPKEIQKEFKLLLEPIKEKIESLRNVFENDLQELYSKNLQNLDLSEKPIAELFVAYVIRAYLIDILQLTCDLCGF